MQIEVGRHLKFFDKDGNELNLTRTHGVWYGMLYFPRVSTSLHEVQHVFITEEVKYEEVISQTIDIDTIPIGMAGVFVVDTTPDPSETLQLHKVYIPEQSITVVDQNNSSNYFIATINGYDNLTGHLFVRVISKFGTGISSSWKIITQLYTYPRGTKNSFISLDWREPDFGDNVFLFETDTTQTVATINKMESAFVTLNDGSTDDIEGVTFSGETPISVADNASLLRVIADGTHVDSRVMQVNLAIVSNEESRYARTLELYYNDITGIDISERHQFVGTGMQNQKYTVDVDQSFQLLGKSFSLYVVNQNSGFDLDSSSSTTPGSMSLVFPSVRSYNDVDRLSAGGTVVVTKKNSPSNLIFCTVKSVSHDPNVHKTTISIEDSAFISGISDFSQYKVLFTLSQINDISIVSDTTKYNPNDEVALLQKDTPTELVIYFGNTTNGYIPGAGNSIVLEWKELQSKQKIAEIALYGEVEAEDDRFKVLLGNLDRDIVSDVGPIFRDSDISEALPDFQLINQKRKELLAAGDEIFPYTGSYRGFINALKFFGYGDLKLKEYWKNIDINSSLYGKYSQTEVPLNLKGINNDDLLPNQAWKKTSRFSLTYEINSLTGTYDEFGQPITQDTFKFTNDEVLIKLFSLKSALKKYFLPLNARIVDITGEGVYFETYATDTWLTRNELITCSPDVLDIKFSVSPSIAYIEDLGTSFKTDFPLDPNIKISDLAEYSINDLSNYELKSFYVNKTSSDFVDDSTANIGATVTCVAETFKLYWENLNMSWDDLHNTQQHTSGVQYTWAGISDGDVYEMEWRIKSQDRIKPFTYVKRGKLTDLETHTVVVPYEGPYDVTLAYYMSSSTRQSKTKTSIFEAMMKSSNIVGFYRASNKATLWNSIRGDWDDSSWTWASKNQGVLRPLRKRNINPLKKTKLFKNTTWEQSVIRWSDLDYYEYASNDYLEDTSNVPIYKIDYANSKVFIEGNYYNPDVPTDELITKDRIVVFRGPDQRNGSSVLDYDPAQKILSLSGEYDPATIDDKFIAVISRKTVESLEFFTLTNDLEYEGYRPQYTVNISGDITNWVRGGSTIEIKLNDDENYSEALVKSSKYVSSTNFTTVVLESLDNRPFNFNIGERDDNIHIASKTGCSVRYFDFVTRLTPGTVTPYSGRTMIFFSDPTGSLNSLPDPTNADNEIIAYWSHVGEDLGFYVSNVSFDGTYTVLTLEDPSGNLPKIDKSHTIDFSNFDVDNARKWAGPSAVSTWDSLNVQWGDVFSRTWESFDYHGSYICGFMINHVAPGGTIRINSGQTFEFPNDEYLTLGDALNSLRTSDIEEIKKFNYSIATYNETMGLVRIRPYTFSIQSSATHSTFTLGSIYFMSPLTETSGIATIKRSKTAKLVYVGVNNISRPVFRVLSVGEIDANGNYSGRDLTNNALTGCFGSTACIVSASSSGSTNTDGIASTTAIIACNGNIPHIEDPYASEYYGFWPYYMAGGYVVNDGYRLDSASTNGVSNQLLKFDFSVDISNLPYFEAGKVINIVNNDGTTKIPLTINSGTYFDFVNSKMVIPVVFSSAYHAVSDVTSYRVFFTEWAYIQDSTVYDSMTEKEVSVDPTYVIYATAKVPGTDALGYVEFGGGVLGPDKNFPTRTSTYPVYDFKIYRLTDDLGSYNPLNDASYRAWQEGGFTFPPTTYFETCDGDLIKSLKTQYGPYLSGSFSWEDLYIGYDHVDALPFSTVFFSLANCQIPGANQVVWSLYDSKSAVLLLRTKGRHFTWTFKDPGYYDVQAEVVDVNNNTKTVYKSGFVRVFDSFENLEFEGCPL